MGGLNPTPEVPWLLDVHPPARTLLRELANAVFAPRLLQTLALRGRALTQKMIEALQSQPEGDLVESPLDRYQ